MTRVLTKIMLLAELEQELIDIKLDYHCKCEHKACRVCEQRKSIDRVLGIEKQE